MMFSSTQLFLIFASYRKGRLTFKHSVNNFGYESVVTQFFILVSPPTPVFCTIFAITHFYCFVVLQISVVDLAFLLLFFFSDRWQKEQGLWAESLLFGEVVS